jgi:hypothetical protein
MKTDKLEKFIIDHRSEFDDLDPSPALWEKIGKREPEKPEVNWTSILLRVAAVIVIFVSSFIFIDYLNNQDNASQLAETEIEAEDGEIYQELIEAEFYYSSQIEQRREEFYQVAGNNTPLREEINIELSELDKIFRDLKEDLKDNADNEEVVVAMIQNYRLKLEILEEILLQLDSSNDKKKDHENEIINM